MKSNSTGGDNFPSAQGQFILFSLCFIFSSIFVAVKFLCLTEQIKKQFYTGIIVLQRMVNIVFSCFPIKCFVLFHLNFWFFAVNVLCLTGQLKKQFDMGIIFLERRGQYPVQSDLQQSRLMKMSKWNLFQTQKVSYSC